ncbi:hypothetical protein NDU88_011793 [Pleurodeles waltl]|uniref:Uncharacterized protein n=1 Tax=Pleurodeles waltl TaxID=8319 RepID=A0AAV7R116_PLEWA|nr:hypothetical protein NDU88_011793 [Pleurodeles waltl]
MPYLCEGRRFMSPEGEFRHSLSDRSACESIGKIPAMKGKRQSARALSARPEIEMGLRDEVAQSRSPR